MRAIRLLNGNLLIPVEKGGAGPDLAEIGPEHPEYGTWLAFAQPGEDPRPFKDRRTWIPREEDLTPDGWRS
jgi:hypothetical protein